MKKRFFLILICFSVYIANAQIITLLQATEQHWAGGICSNHGINYIISFESIDTVHNISIDTVWIENKFYIKNSKNNFIVFNSIINGKMFYQITVAEFWNNNELPDIVDKNESPLLTLIYSGQGCVVFHYKKKRMLMPVISFVELEPIDYP